LSAKKEAQKLNRHLKLTTNKGMVKLRRPNNRCALTKSLHPYCTNIQCTPTVIIILHYYQRAEDDYYACMHKDDSFWHSLTWSKGLPALFVSDLVNRKKGRKGDHNHNHRGSLIISSNLNPLLVITTNERERQNERRGEEQTKNNLELSSWSESHT